MLACELRLVAPTAVAAPVRRARPLRRPAVRPVPAGVRSVERELAAVLEAAGLHARQRRAVATRLGWDGGGGATLAEAGTESGYTRERVRQLEALVRDHVARTRPELPLTRRALELVDAAAPARRRDVALALRSAGVCAEAFDPAGILAAADLAGILVPVALTGALVAHAAAAERVADAVGAARRLARHPGAVSAAAVASPLGLSEAETERLLLLGNDLTRIADGWFAVRGRPSRNERRLRKVLAVTGPLHVSELADALARGPRATPLPEHVLLGLCRVLEWVAVDTDDVVASLEPLDLAEELSPAEQIVLRVLLVHGPLPLADAVARAAAAGVTPATAQFVLRYAPVTRAVGGGRVAARAAADARRLPAAGG